MINLYNSKKIQKIIIKSDSQTTNNAISHKISIPQEIANLDEENRSIVFLLKIKFNTVIG